VLPLCEAFRIIGILFRKSEYVLSNTPQTLSDVNVHHGFRTSVLQL